MATKMKTTYTLVDWKEEPHHEVEGELKMTQAKVNKAYTGDFEGSGTLDYLMTYRADGVVHFVGMERMVGSVGDKKGSFVLQDIGIFEGCHATGALTVISGTGTGDFEGLEGTGSYALKEDGATTFPVELQLTHKTNKS